MSMRHRQQAGATWLVALALWVAWAGVAVAQTGTATRTLSVGATPAPPTGSSVRLDGLGTSGGTNVLFADGDGDIFERLIAKTDLPATTGYTDEAETWSLLQTFSSGIALRDGSCSADGGALYFSADTDTGLARSGGNAMVLCTGGSTRLTINNTGTTAAGTLTSSGTFTASTTASVGSTLGVTGLSTLTGGFSAGANSSVTGTLGVSGLATLTSGFAAGADSTITGSLTASGDVAVNGGDLTSSAATLDINAGGTVRINDALVMASANTIRSANFASRTTGWGITYAGEADFRYTYADEFYTKNFIADLETALNGGQIIAKSTVVLAQDFTCPAAAGTATLWVRDFPGHGNLRVFAANDWVVLRSMTRADADNDGNIEFSIGDCVGQVSSYTDGTSGNDGTQSWTFTRGSGGNAGGMASSTVVAADALVIDYGVSGQGFLVARANDGTEGSQSPYWQAVTWTTSPVAANMALQTRWGQLNGAYGYSASTFGLCAGNAADVFLCAEPTNGLRIMEGGTNEMLRADPTGYIRVGMQGAGQPNTYIDSGVVAIRVATTPWVRLTTSGVEVGQTSSGQGNTFIDTSGNYFARSGTVNRFTIAGSNGNSDWLDDDGTTVRARIGSTAAYFGSLAGERFQFTYGGALEAYNSAGTLYASLSAANGWLLGNWYTTGSNKGYAQMTDRYFRLCKTGIGCTLEFDGDTGGITSTGSLSIQGAATIGGSGSFAAGNVSLTTSGVSITPSTGSADWDSTRAYRFPFTPSGAVGGMYAADLADQGNVFVSTQGTDYTHSHFSTLSSLISDVSGGDAGTYAATISAATGDDALVTGARAQMRVQTSAGTNSLTIYPTQLLIDGSSGFDGTKTVRNSAGTGTCTLVFTYGILTGGTC
ncbi:hypothetical protein [Luteitalea sp.]|uniref:hypothetical protein n=1 Tax=Luteitalea sp. TaxID=2004800 RepID=UPI0025B8891A|nr:hypothetical protein [Luteitalea sp.]